MKLFLTGGAGYIGSIATEILVRQGHHVTVFDNLQQGHRAAVTPAADLIVGDLSRPMEVEAALLSSRPDAVIHFAANSLVGESMNNPFLYLGNNVVNALNLLKAMENVGVRKIILSSTANLFSEPENVPIAESERVTPGSPYGESKYIVERQLHWLAITRGWRYACLRYFNAAGATKNFGEDHDPELHLILLILQVAQGKRKQIVVFGRDYSTPDGTCIRDYVHVEDLIDAHARCLSAIDVENRIYNLGNGRGFSVLEVIEAARKITGRCIPVEFGPRRPGDPAVLVAASDKIRRELDWRPHFTAIEPIVASAWDWYQRHPNGYAAKCDTEA